MPLQREIGEREYMPLETTPNFAFLFLKTILAMVLVLGVAIVFIRYIMPRLYGPRVGGKQSLIHVVSRLSIEPRKALWIIRVGDKISLVGSAEQVITKIMDLEERDLS